ncbi:MAG: hypothetical protein ACI4HI_09420, partial [Lachnospiraceae bacterium]
PKNGYYTNSCVHCYGYIIKPDIIVIYKKPEDSKKFFVKSIECKYESEEAKYEFEFRQTEIQDYICQFVFQKEQFEVEKPLIVTFDKKKYENMKEKDVECQYIAIDALLSANEVC